MMPIKNNDFIKFINSKKNRNIWFDSIKNIFKL